jgi:palmitoyltransferase
MCNDKGMKRFGWVFVTVTVLLITITPAIANVYVYDPWLSYHTERNYYLWLAPFNLSVLSIWINYYLACRTNPGYVNSSYQPQQNKVSAKPRWCKDCLCYKAPRAHHCSLCNKCIVS